MITVIIIIAIIIIIIKILLLTFFLLSSILYAQKLILLPNHYHLKYNFHYHQSNDHLHLINTRFLHHLKLFLTNFN